MDYPSYLATYARYKKKPPPPLQIAGDAGKKEQPKPPPKWKKFFSSDDPEKLYEIYTVKINNGNYLIFSNRRLTGRPAININGNLDGMPFRFRPAGLLDTPTYRDDPQPNPWLLEALHAHERADTSDVTLNGLTISGNQSSPTQMSAANVRRLHLRPALV